MSFSRPWRRSRRASCTSTRSQTGAAPCGSSGLVRCAGTGGRQVGGREAAITPRELEQIPTAGGDLVRRKGDQARYHVAEAQRTLDGLAARALTSELAVDEVDEAIDAGYVAQAIAGEWIVDWRTR
jgi:hypothetical protein